MTQKINYNKTELLNDATFIPNPHNYITVRGAREHNLKNISIVIPKDELVVFSGLSGSGKSSLVFDTIYAEGQRRYVESLSSYARQFLGLKEKPDVDSIDGLSPAISIDQKSTSQNPRSTVGTITEIHDYLRLLYAKIGVQHDPETGAEVKVETVTQMVSKLIQLGDGKMVVMLSPLIHDQKGWHKQKVVEAKSNNFKRLRIDGKIVLTEEAEKLDLDRNKKHSIEAVIDRLVIGEENRVRLSDSLELAMKHGNGKVTALIMGDDEDREVMFNRNGGLGDLEPRQFSFNSPHGACPTCSGLGTVTEVDASLVVPNENLSISEGCIRPFSKVVVSGGWFSKILEDLGKKYKFSLNSQWKKLTEKQKHVVLYGDGGNFEGVITNLQRRYKETTSEVSRKDIESYMTKCTCSTCKGARLKSESLAVTVAGANISQVSEMSISNCLEHFEKLQENKESLLSNKDSEIAKLIFKEISTRLKFLDNVGLGYLTLSRSANTLSGGEAQRIRLATQIGSGLTGVLYILDEPSIGLHQRDNTKLLDTLKKLRDLGNTVLIVEHDEETMRMADFLVDIGPMAGNEGGHVIATGTPEEVMENENSPTGRFLAGKEVIEIPKQRRKVLPKMPKELGKEADEKLQSGESLDVEKKNNLDKERAKYDKYITIYGAKENNLKDVSIEVPLRKFICVTGVSGSGKSTLVNDIFSNELMNYFYDSRLVTGDFDDIEGLNNIDKPIIIDQSPIGRTPRSNPATYTGLFTPIRELFASLPESRARGYNQGRFSFNVEGGRCETCQGDGLIKVEMNFLPDVYVVCEDCKGRRYNRETLDIKYRGKTVADVLDMSVKEGVEFFENHKLIYRKLKTLMDVGLGYIKLGQSATTLSGGEAQRVKLATELSKVGTGNTLYILDEPTTGLHPIDVKMLLNVLHQLVDKGNTVLVIEHNLDVIKTADWIIDLGPEGGDKGGEIVAIGTPEEVAEAEGSYTGQYLKNVLK